MERTLTEEAHVSLADVVAMCVAGELAFEVGTRHHGKNIEEAALQRIKEDPRLLKIVRETTKRKCPIFFIQGSKCKVRRNGVYIGIDAPVDEIATLLDLEI